MRKESQASDTFSDFIHSVGAPHVMTNNNVGIKGVSDVWQLVVGLVDLDIPLFFWLHSTIVFSRFFVFTVFFTLFFYGFFGECKPSFNNIFCLTMDDIIFDVAYPAEEGWRPTGTFANILAAVSICTPLNW